MYYKILDVNILEILWYKFWDVTLGDHVVYCVAVCLWELSRESCVVMIEA